MTITVTVIGGGTFAGARYVAFVAEDFPPLVRVVTTVSVPQDPPLQSAPANAHTRSVLGLELAAGVSVLTRVDVLPAATFAGALNCNAKVLVMGMDILFCFVVSATLVAVSVTLAGFGRTRGAVKFPLASTLPHPVAHAALETLQVTAVLGCPALLSEVWNACVAPSSTLAFPWGAPTTMSLVTVMLAVANFETSAWLVAVIRTG